MRTLVLASIDNDNMVGGHFYLLEKNVANDTIKYTNIGKEISAVLIRATGITAMLPGRLDSRTNEYGPDVPVQGYKMEIQYSDIHPVEETVEFRLSREGSIQLMNRAEPWAVLALRATKIQHRRWKWHELVVNDHFWPTYFSEPVKILKQKAKAGKV